jgi:hypothetical protein
VKDLKDLKDWNVYLGEYENTIKEIIEFSLEKLRKDCRHSLSDKVVSGLTYKQLIGVLLVSRNVIEKEERLEKEEHFFIPRCGYSNEQ